MKKKTILVIALFLVSMALFFLLTPVKYIPNGTKLLGGSAIHFLATATVYFLFTFFAFKRFGGKLSAGWLLAVILGGASAIELVARIIDFQATLTSLPDFIVRILSILAGYAFYRVKSVGWRISMVAAMCLLFGWFALSGYPMWWMKLAYGTFTGKVDIQAPAVVFDRPEGGGVSVGEFYGSYLVLDLWNSGCGYCYLAFPDVQAWYDKLDREKAVLYAVHCRQADKGETASTGHDILAERGFTFPSLSLDIESPFIKESGITGYPTVLVLNTEGRVVYKGGVAGAVDYLDKALGME